MRGVLLRILCLSRDMLTSAMRCLAHWLPLREYCF